MVRKGQKPIPAASPARPIAELFAERDYRRMLEQTGAPSATDHSSDPDGILLMSVAAERLGRPSDAAAMLDQALDQRRRLLPADAARLLVRKAELMNEVSRSTTALAALEQAEALSPDARTGLALGIERGRALAGIGEQAEAREMLERAGVAAAKDGQAELEARAALTLALIDFREGQLDRAEERCRTVLESHPGLSADPRAAAHRFRAITRSAACRYHEALDDFAAALTLYRDLNHLRGMLRTYMSMAVTYEEMGENGPAEVFLEKALALAEEDQDPSSLGVALSRLGIVHLARRQLDQAWRYFARDLDQMKDVENARNSAFPLRNLGRVLRLLDRPAEAREKLAESVRIYESVQDRQNALLARLELLLVENDPIGKRLATLARLREELIAAGRESLAPYTHEVEAMLLVQARRFEEAEVAFARVDCMYRDGRRVSRRAELHADFAAACAAAGNRELAVKVYSRGLEFASRCRLAELSRLMATALGKLDEDAYIARTLEDAPAIPVASKSIGPAAGPDELVGAGLSAVRDLIKSVAPTPAPVLLLGETGTGKEIAARAIHAESRRKAGPFIPVNCGAIPFELVEAELFGHVRGAFTGAVESRPGAFELAEAGTIFLDEVADLPLSAQVKLLRVLQTGEYNKVGDARPRTVDVRVLAATHRDIPTEIWGSRFRPDLYYRLAAFEIRLPPLRDRLDDLADLVTTILARNAYARERGIASVSAAALRRLREHTWPGNVRELENVLTRAAILAQKGQIGIRELPDFGSRGPGNEKFTTLDSVMRTHVEEAMRRAGNNQSKAAELLGVHRNTLRRWLARRPD